jgi:LacI family transcriptional regulator
MSVPGDLSVVGVDDLDMSAHLSPSLTTVHIPTARIGAEAAAMLLRAIRDGTRPPAIDLPVELVVRRSTGPIGSDQPRP